MGTPTRPGSPDDLSRPCTPNSLFSYAAATILTQEQVADRLGVSTHAVRKLPIRRWASSRRFVRYVWNGSRELHLSYSLARIATLQRVSPFAAMTRAGIEPAAYGLKVRCSTN